MIYVPVGPDTPIRQGDIFKNIPRVDLDLSDLSVISREGTVEFARDWSSLAESHDRITVSAAIKPVYAIVITQDCDAVRIDDVALCEIDRFAAVERMAETALKPKSMVGLITKQSRLNLKWFYLPPDPTLGFTERMAADFQTIISTSRSYLEKHIAHLRLGRLNNIAGEHFRERASEFFRRYPYDEWYPLDKAEFELYRQEKPEPIVPFPWQE